jgi:formylglycine-generating enzyme required for sulfatase activity
VVSVERYAAFLRGLPVAEQRTRVPRTGATSDEPGEPLWSLGPDGYDPPAASRNLPVEGISFADAEAFATARGERLPTAAEWTWAATAGLGIATPAGALDLLLRQGARVETPDRGPAPVGATPFDRTPFGVLDLSGNVAEITGTMRSWEGRQGWIVLGGAYCLGVSRALIGHAEARPGWQVSAGVGFRLVRPATALGR